MNFIEIEDKFYILATSSFADDRIRVLKQGDTFGIFDRFGDIHLLGQGAQGLFHEGTRYVSRMELAIENQRPLLLSSNLREENELLTVDLTNPDYPSGQGAIVERGTLHILRHKFLWNGVCYEKINIANYGIEPVSFAVTMAFDADYADIFEVRGMIRQRKGKRLPSESNGSEVLLGYKGLDDVIRQTRIHFDPAPLRIDKNTAYYQIALAPKQTFDLYINIGFELAPQIVPILPYRVAYNRLNNYMRRVKHYTCDIFTSNDQFNHWVNRSEADLITMITLTENGPYPYAGVPWYSTPFGRDGIITAYECLWITPEVAHGVLHYLAATQATQTSAFQDAEPGKILHEKRGGEMAELGEIPFKQYYGTVDATPLFICLAGAYYERTDDLATIQTIWPNIESALGWIDKYGDLDGDGFLEYARKADTGLNNQGWKDSHDSVFYENGELAETPIALCEVQGYVYDAKLSAATLADALGYTEQAQSLRNQAYKIKEKFEAAFWSDEKQTFILALAANNKPCNVVASNAGHCLFSGIATPEHAQRLAHTLLDPKMSSGWGIRTLAADEQRYNPMSYHNGSIWPHDNALIAYGFARYGFKKEVNQVLSAIFDATLFVEHQRLPELYCGFDRRYGEGPTSYPVACSPQAWSVAAVFMLIQACLGLKIIAKTNTIVFYKPSLPSFLDEIIIRDLKVNGSSITLQIRRQGEGVVVNNLSKESKLKMELVNEGGW